MKKVKEEVPYIPEKAKELFPKVDFADTFSTTNHSNTMEEIANLVFNTSPKWVEALFALRNRIVKVFGLKTSLPDDYTGEFRVGGYVKFFKIYSISEQEVIMGADDSHLNFRAIIANTSASSSNIKVTTLVRFNNAMGRIYMGIIKPFHRLVVMQMVKNAYSKS
ncbi:DUF2867 domain-containing protein [Flammeovirgaceae bacterium SG7u.111]|nr:DUF2867 domain-containing protein [Flammeovirgaceae bacterium SG7u.132]WPO33529.1 DUF2867 domain-containing protein [Flammeovirgaceae bacterium SG7u.111]